jgi:hypothetical protein
VQVLPAIFTVTVADGGTLVVSQADHGGKQFFGATRSPKPSRDVPTKG